MATSDGITIDATTLQPVASPATVPSTPPIAVQQVAPNARRDSQNNDPKNPAALNFRAVLNATTFSGIAQSTSAAPSGADPVERATKLPESEPTELSAGETAGLFAASQVTRGSDASRAPDRVYQVATQRYVQAFFAATPTFARPGESLELKA